LYAHEPEAGAVATERAAWRVVAALQARLARAEGARDMARRHLEERQQLLARGRAGLDAGRADLDALAAETAALAAGLAAHEASIAALERAWKDLVRDRLRGLERALAELERGSVRIAARYPEDRSVRPVEPVAAARATTTAERAWIAAADSLHADVTGQFEARIAAIFQQHELAADKEKLARLLAEIAALRVPL
jgi:chromosome segregation ATPase